MKVHDRERKFTFGRVLRGVISSPSPTLSFPCWIVGEGRRARASPIRLPLEPARREGGRIDARNHGIGLFAQQLCGCQSSRGRRGLDSKSSLADAPKKALNTR